MTAVPLLVMVHIQNSYMKDKFYCTTDDWLALKVLRQVIISIGYGYQNQYLYVHAFHKQSAHR